MKPSSESYGGGLGNLSDPRIGDLQAYGLEAARAGDSCQTLERQGESLDSSLDEPGNTGDGSRDPINFLVELPLSCGPPVRERHTSGRRKPNRSEWRRVLKVRPEDPLCSSLPPKLDDLAGKSLRRKSSIKDLIDRAKLGGIPISSEM